MKPITYKGKHAEICREIATGHKDEALQLIYAFFRSEENTDSYSVSLLTTIRELLDEGDSDELYRIRIRMRGNGDRVLLNLAQFVSAFEMGDFTEIAETLAEKCFSELPRLSRSMQDFADEEGLSSATEMAGMRIREAVRILKMYAETYNMSDEIDRCDDIGLEMSRVFLFTHANIMSEDLMKAAKSAMRNNDELKCIKLCNEIVREYGDVADRIANASEFSREDYETIVGVRYAYEQLHKMLPEHPYGDEIKKIEQIMDETNA
ncbi:MAG: hypothetical protein J6A01_07465 [Proteobacteria bacterium]|nr:hypothetical protein [Pseudomonadota bacterium]